MTLADLAPVLLSQPILAGLRPQPADALLALIDLHRDDPRPDKIDLGVGVFRNDTGATPVMRAVKQAETSLLASQSTKAYLGAEGDTRYVELLSHLVLGNSLARSSRIVGLQTPGGTGALRLAAELIALGSPEARIWIGTPTWPNHAQIFEAARLEVISHRHYDDATGLIAFGAMMDDLSKVRPGDVVLLHGCCHNPTGADFSAEQWKAIAALLDSRSAIPLIDIAYAGLGNGFDKDAQALRMILEQMPQALVTFSCSKIFGLYRERTGILWVQGPDTPAASLIYGNLLKLARSLWSMPPDHGAAIVRIILDDPQLYRAWLDELETMRLRINGLRASLAETHPRLAALANQRGMFAMLPISPDDVRMLRETHGIYMAGSGRINIAGLRDGTVSQLGTAIAPFLDQRS